MSLRMILLMMAAAMACGLSLQAVEARSTAAAAGAPPDSERLAWWRDARFGMFIHWGVYALLGKGEWIRTVDQIPQEEYAKLPPQFNPTKFDPDEWADLAKRAGMQYMVVTTKHHDGFCEWDTKQTDFNIMHSPFGRDVVKELAAACKREGLAFGTYHSVCDWHNPAPVPAARSSAQCPIWARRYCS